MANLNQKSNDELLAMLGRRISELRLLKKLDQVEAAEKAGIAPRSLIYLEMGHSATLNTLLKILRALDALDGMELLAPKPAGKPTPLPRGPHAKERRLQPTTKPKNKKKIS